MLCGGRSLVKLMSDGGVAVTLRCRAWTCPDCAPLRKNQLIDLAKSGRPDRFVTLTSNPRVGVSPADRAARLARAWRVVLARARRQWPGRRWEYLAVFEATKRGEPHLHVLVRGPFLPQRWLSEQMRDVAEAPIVDIRQVKSVRQAAAYVAKYIGKAPHRFATCKRYWHTRGWSGASATAAWSSPWGEGGWSVDDRPVWAIEEDARALHLPVERVGDGVVRWRVSAWLAEQRPHLAAVWSWSDTS